jgi:chromosome segregation ATPase
MNNRSRLAHSLETLIEELSSWSFAAGDFDKTASYDLKQQEEVVVGVDHRIRITANQLANDREMVRKASETLLETNDLATRALHFAHQQFTQVKETLDQANQTLQHWETELATAKTWLAQAFEWLAMAQARLQQAQTKSLKALRALQDAEDALYKCRNDDTSKGCWGEEVTVYRAQEQVETAYAEAFAVEQAVRGAEDELARAQTRITACTRATKFSQEAVKVAQATVAAAQQEINYAERSLEYIEAAKRALQEMQKVLKSEEEAVEDMIVVISLAKASVDEAKGHFNTAEYCRDTAMRHAANAQQALKQQVEQLRERGKP